MATNDNYVSEMGFADIVDDCLWYTLEHLSFREKFGVMRVCKRWQKVTAALIEKESSLELNLMKKDESENVANNRKYTDEESVKQNLITIFGKEASLFNYKLEHVNHIRIIGLEGPSDLPEDTSEDTSAFHSRFRAREASPTFNSRPLTLADIVWLFKRFPQLKALSFDYVEILEPKSRMDQQLNKLSNRLKSLRLRSSDNKFTLDSLILKSNLEELRLKKRPFNFYMYPQHMYLPSIKVISVKASVATVLYAVGAGRNVSEIRVRGLCPDLKRGAKAYSLTPFMKLPQLRTLAIGYDTRRSIGLADGGETALYEYLSGKTDSLKFSNLKLFKLSGLVMSPEELDSFLSKMSTIESLRLRNIYFSVRPNVVRQSSKASDYVFNCLTTLPNLRELHLNNNTDKDCNECLMASLAKIISDERLPKLRKLKCCLMDLFSPFLYEAFTNLAWKHSRESFAMTAPFYDQPNKADLLAVKPRNLIAIHCRCTSKQETR